jgi:predicted DNA-binding transcriptional regulator YafY
MLNSKEYELLIRRKALLELLKSREYPISKHEIREQLDDFNFSDRTLDRDLKEYKQFLTITRIEVSGKHVNGYKILNEGVDEEELDFTLDEEIQTLDEALSLMLLRYKLGEKSKSTDYMSGGRGAYAGGSFWMSKIMMAMRENYCIKFNYTKYGETAITNRIIEPYHLRLKDNLWYLVGKETSTGFMKIFGLDRVSDLKLSDNQFTRDPAFDPQAYFKNYIGIYTDEGRNPEKITINVWGDFIKRLKSLPLHESQQITEETADYIIITLNVVPNTEFYTEILKLRDKASILSPASVKNKMKEFLTRMLMGYE